MTGFNSNNFERAVIFLVSLAVELPLPFNPPAPPPPEAELPPPPLEAGTPPSEGGEFPPP